MQGVGKISQRHIFKYVSKKFFPQRSSWDEIWIFRGKHAKLFETYPHRPRL